ncbi:MAG: hypothetical protein PQJ58_06260 [Spirochaetales bacterium]|nr:hypothetical protein [Spirochaetales bacterium]
MSSNNKLRILTLLISSALLLFILLIIFAFGRRSSLVQSDYDLPDKVIELNNSTEDFHIFKIAHSMPVSHPQNTALREKISFEIQKNQSVSIIPEIYHSRQLGSPASLWHAVQKGTVEMILITADNLWEIPELSLFSIPYLFNSYSELQSFMNLESVEKAMISLFRKKGVMYMGWSFDNHSHIIRTGTEQTGLPSLGLEHQNEYLERYLKEAGFRAFDFRDSVQTTQFRNLPFAFMEVSSEELYGKEGGIDLEGIELRNFLLSPCLYLINQEFWDNLSPMERVLLRTAVNDSLEYQKELVLNQEDMFQQYFDKEFSKPDVSYRFNSRIYESWKSEHGVLFPEGLR